MWSGQWRLGLGCSAAGEVDVVGVVGQVEVAVGVTAELGESGCATADGRWWCQLADAGRAASRWKG